MELIKIISLLTLSSILIGFVLNKLLRKQIDFEITLFQNYIAGLIVIYLCVLTGIRLDFLVQGLFYFTILSSGSFIYYFFKGRKIKISILQVGFMFLFSIIAVYFTKDILHSIVYDPIHSWDSRSIWYLKARQLFFANGFNENTGIQNDNGVFFSHPEYPFLVPALGALVTEYVGYWNEYLPKTNLILLWIGVVLAFCSLKNMHILFKIAIFISLFIISPSYITLGLMDIWLGIYASLSILFLIEYTRCFRSDYLLTSLSCMIFCNYIKHDASLITLVIWTSFGALLLLSRNKRFMKYTLYKVIKMLPLLFILGLPFLYWTYYKNKMNLAATDFDFGKLTHFSMYENTFTLEKFKLIYNSLVVPIKFLKVFVILSVVVILSILYGIFSKFTRPVIKNGIIICCFPILASVLFVIGMHILYCLSRNDLAWHLSTSAQRLRLNMLFISLPALYGTGSLFFYFPFKLNLQKRKKKKGTKPSKTKKIKKR